MRTVLLVVAAAVLAQTAVAASAPPTYVLWSSAADGSSRRAVAVLPSDLFTDGARLTDWSRDRTHIVVVGAKVTVATLAGLERMSIVLPQALVPEDARFSPDGKRIVVTAADPSCGAPIGRLDCLELFVARADGTAADVVLAARGTAAEWSPDSRRLAYVGGVARNDFGTLYLVGADGARRRKIATGAYGWVRPTFSPRGSHIAYGSRTGPRVVGVGGSFDQGGFSASSAVWSPDGKQLLFAVGARGINRSVLAVMTVSNGHTRILTNSQYNGTNDVPLAWAPDGKSVVFQRTCEFSPCQTAVYRQSLVTGGKRRLSHDNRLWLETRWTAGRLGYFSAS